MQQFHAALEAPRAEPHERHAVAMVRVHVGLHLEHETRHLIFARFDRTLRRLA
jgi:hypothetical protein